MSEDLSHGAYLRWWLTDGGAEPGYELGAHAEKHMRLRGEGARVLLREYKTLAGVFDHLAQEYGGHDSVLAAEAFRRVLRVLT